MTTRPAIERTLNKAGHIYTWCAYARCHICRECGTAEHANGDFWLVGQYSSIEPPCTGNHIGLVEWRKGATPSVS